MHTGGGLRPADIRKAVHDRLASIRGWLLVLDNADSVDVVKPYLPPGTCAGMGHVVLTTRVGWFRLVEAGVLGPSARVLALTSLPPSDAVAMLVSVQQGAVVDAAGASGVLGGVGSAAARAAEELVGPEGLGGLPLAVHQAASYMRGQDLSVEQYAALYDKKRLELFGSGPQPREQTPWQVRRRVERRAALPRVCVRAVWCAHDSVGVLHCMALVQCC